MTSRPACGSRVFSLSGFEQKRHFWLQMRTTCKYPIFAMDAVFLS